MIKTYKELTIYQDSFTLFVEVHNFTMALPKYELFEQGSQLRRSSDSVNSNIVEGYGRKDYKNDFLRFLTYAHASNQETVNHLRKISTVHPELGPKAIALMNRYDILGGQIYKFREYVRRSWRSSK